MGRRANVGAARIRCRNAVNSVWILVILGLSIGLTGCRTFNVKTDWDASVDFTSPHRFFFVDPPKVDGANPFADNSLLRKRVRFAVETALAERGFQLVSDREDADLLVTYIVVLDDELRVNGVSSGVGGYRGRGVGYAGGYATANVRTYQESTLILDLLDPASEDLVWRGWGTGIIGTRNRGRSLERMDKGVRAILAKFPPGIGSERD